MCVCGNDDEIIIIIIIMWCRHKKYYKREGDETHNKLYRQIEGRSKGGMAYTNPHFLLPQSLFFLSFLDECLPCDGFLL